MPSGSTGTACPEAGSPGTWPGAACQRQRYADIVTEGFRTIRVGERVCFLTDTADPTRAIYVIRLDLPDVDAYYD